MSSITMRSAGNTLYPQKHQVIYGSDGNEKTDAIKNRGMRFYDPASRVKQTDNGFVKAVKTACGHVGNFFRRLTGQAVSLKSGGENYTVNKLEFSHYIARACLGDDSSIDVNDEVAQKAFQAFTGRIAQRRANKAVLILTGGAYVDSDVRTEAHTNSITTKAEAKTSIIRSKPANYLKGRRVTVTQVQNPKNLNEYKTLVQSYAPKVHYVSKQTLNMENEHLGRYFDQLLSGDKRAPVYHINASANSIDFWNIAFGTTCFGRSIDHFDEEHLKNTDRNYNDDNGYDSDTSEIRSVSRSSSFPSRTPRSASDSDSEDGAGGAQITPQPSRRSVRSRSSRSLGRVNRQGN